MHALTELCMAVSFVSPVKLIYASLLTRVKYLISKKIIYVGQRRIAKKKLYHITNSNRFFLSDVHVHVYEKKCIKKLKSFNTINVET